MNDEKKLAKSTYSIQYTDRLTQSMKLVSCVWIANETRIAFKCTNWNENWVLCTVFKWIFAMIITHGTRFYLKKCSRFLLRRYFFVSCAVASIYQFGQFIVHYLRLCSFYSFAKLYNKLFQHVLWRHGYFSLEIDANAHNSAHDTHFQLNILNAMDSGASLAQNCVSVLSLSLGSSSI